MAVREGQWVHGTFVDLHIADGQASEVCFDGHAASSGATAWLELAAYLEDLVNFRARTALNVRLELLVGQVGIAVGPARFDHPALVVIDEHLRTSQVLVAAFIFFAAPTDAEIHPHDLRFAVLKFGCPFAGGSSLVRHRAGRGPAVLGGRQGRVVIVLCIPGLDAILASQNARCVVLAHLRAHTGILQVDDVYPFPEHELAPCWPLLCYGTILVRAHRGHHP